MLVMPGLGGSRPLANKFSLLGEFPSGETLSLKVNVTRRMTCEVDLWPLHALAHTRAPSHIHAYAHTQNAFWMLRIC